MAGRPMVLRDCIPPAADPERLGFAEAAVKIASTLRTNPWTEDGRPANGAIVRLHNRFDLTGPRPSRISRNETC